MGNSKNTLAVLLQILTVILTTIIHFYTSCYISANVLTQPALVILAILIIVETFVYKVNIASFRNCKKRSINACTVFLIIAFVLNVPITIKSLYNFLLLCILFFA